MLGHALWRWIIFQKKLNFDVEVSVPIIFTCWPQGYRCCFPLAFHTQAPSHSLSAFSLSPFTFCSYYCYYFSKRNLKWGKRKNKAPTILHTMVRSHGWLLPSNGFQVLSSLSFNSFFCFNFILFLESFYQTFLPVNYLQDVAFSQRTIHMNIACDHTMC